MKLAGIDINNYKPPPHMHALLISHTCALTYCQYKYIRLNILQYNSNTTCTTSITLSLPEKL